MRRICTIQLNTFQARRVQRCLVKYLDRLCKERKKSLENKNYDVTEILDEIINEIDDVNHQINDNLYYHK